MKKIVDHLSGRQLHLALLFIPVVLFLFKLLLLNHTGWAAIITGEILILGTVVLYMLYGIMFIRRRYVETPIALVKKLGSTGFIIFTLGIIFGAVWPNTTASEYGFLLRLAAIIVSLLTASLVAFLLAGFRELSFLGQKQSPEKFFNVILGFMVLVFFLTEGKPNGVGSVFYAVAFILFFIHSIIRVAWIAFLTKKEKYQLLGIAAFYIFAFTCIGVFSFFPKSGPGETTQLLSFFQVLSNVSPGLVVLVRLMAICWSVYLSVVFFITLFHLPTAEVMDRKAVEATSIKGLNKLMTRVFDFKELADTVTAITAEVCHSDSAWLVTKTESGFTVNATENIDAEEAREISTVLLKDQRLFIDRVTTLNTGTIKSRLKGTGVSKEIKTLTVAPLLVRESISGYLFASCSQALGFDKGDEGAIAAFADHAALALDNAR
ncbi:MAG: hypothetical protein GY757_46450, partial [bacterium]|nr:hypothetical protein [bacterium]